MSGPSKYREKANAVFEGGGVKGIGLAGALSVASRHYDWAYVAGTSAGSMIAALVAAGYTPEEIREMISTLDYRRFEDADVLGQFPLLGPFYNLRFNLGIYKGNYIEDWIREKLGQKGIRRFGDLAVKDNPRYPMERYRLHVIASDISRSRLLVLPQDISQYGINPDDLEVAEAIRMSASIPFFFQPVVLDFPDSDGTVCKNFIVDGGLLSNFPVWLFDRPGPGRIPTIGFRLTGPGDGRPHRITGPVSMLSALFGTMLEAHDNRYLEEKNFHRTISVPAMGVQTTDFNISKEKIEELYQSGVQAAEKFFDTWNYRYFLARFPD